MNFQLVYRYILSLSNNEIMFKKKKKKNDWKKGKKGLLRRESNPG